MPFCIDRSTVPSAFAGYSFHVAEAALVFCNEIVEIFVFPIHAGLHRGYHLYATLIHIGSGWPAPEGALYAVPLPAPCPAGCSGRQ